MSEPLPPIPPRQQAQIVEKLNKNVGKVYGDVPDILEFKIRQWLERQDVMETLNSEQILNELFQQASKDAAKAIEKENAQTLKAALPVIREELMKELKQRYLEQDKPTKVWTAQEAEAAEEAAIKEALKEMMTKVTKDIEGDAQSALIDVKKMMQLYAKRLKTNYRTAQKVFGDNPTAIKRVLDLWSNSVANAFKTTRRGNIPLEGDINAGAGNWLDSVKREIHAELMLPPKAPKPSMRLFSKGVRAATSAMKAETVNKEKKKKKDEDEEDENNEKNGILEYANVYDMYYNEWQKKRNLQNRKLSRLISKQRLVRNMCC